MVSISLDYISPFLMAITSPFVSFQPPRKPRLSRQKDVISRSDNKHPVPLGSEETVDSQLDFSVSESSHFVSGGSTGFAAAASQPPIGTPPANSESQTIKYTFFVETLILVFCIAK